MVDGGQYVDIGHLRMSTSVSQGDRIGGRVLIVVNYNNHITNIHAIADYFDVVMGLKKQ